MDYITLRIIVRRLSRGGRLREIVSRTNRYGNEGIACKSNAQVCYASSAAVPRRSECSTRQEMSAKKQPFKMVLGCRVSAARSENYPPLNA
ncbi:hypothetical protein GAO09_00740 [Rhizobiales bacterium RZME27]|uniref:Uncharacterized protein n=1 Tax=Endobacterium cereale TaxID=2663029 RepID=A0A6A8A6X9_9HYPH|nr:hypothetical protein [Endobacterium cereale]MEB2843485.1 hypothetical protein [Endobacterium cereale]MQY44601.1 hypothetical protein [Endobacterium cereale]